ncbi:gibberellin-regulated protein 6-like [Chenopodium quinoa]|uniref:gibberellin-regulated protein 6-like n=1 Tax=Chenopodium quinoa TaxID=63459 RepID=UPI000B77DA2D|nr:gibberellin-regulated protein 6-like [Chenopodium quinoa]
MANIKAMSLLLAFLVVAMLVSETFAGTNYYGNNSLTLAQCPGRCKQRCSKARKTEECNFFCNKCCRKCLCVPPGTFGYKELCPCYNNWKTKRGGPKCP